MSTDPVSRFVRSMSLSPINDTVITTAMQLTGELKSLDAIHLATALVLRHAIDEPVTVVTYDRQLAAAALACDLEVTQPQ